MNGIIIVNKPKDITSHDVVDKMRRILCLRSIGHAGTLDPIATGVLPILVGGATKVSKYLMEHDKEYIVTLRLGYKTDTGDTTGEEIERVEVPKSIFDEENIKDILESFIGKQEQTPSMYSAIKIKGKKLYEYARAGETVEVPKRMIEIYRVDLMDMNEEAHEIKYRVQCSKGTYMRSLCEDIAKELGTIGTMSDLVRTKAGEFSIDNVIDLSTLERMSIEEIKRVIIPIETSFNKYGEIKFKTDNELRMFLNGMRSIYKQKSGVYRIYDKNEKFIGIGTISNGLLKRDVVL